jgi:GDP-4-dehydro-6-deoxy-D-mannose reductase
MDKQKVVVTGINGFVGHHLARELHENNLSVIGIGRDESVSPEIAEIVDEYYSADLVQQWPEVGDVDAIIHLAGLAAVGPSFDQPQLYINANSAMVTNMCEYYQKADKKPRVVIVSSGAIYDSQQEMPITESSAIGFNSPYAVSKILTENQASYYKTRGLDCIVARPFNHIGPGQGEGFLVPALAIGLIEAKKNNTPLRVGNLKTKRDYTDVRDVAKAYRLLVITPALAHTIYNVCSGKSTSGEDMLATIQEATHIADVAVEVDQSKIRPNDPMDIYGDSTALQRDTGWLPSIPLSKTIADYVAGL